MNILFILLLHVINAKVFPIAWDPKTCSRSGCEVIKTFVEKINGTLKYTNCTDECEFYMDNINRYNSSLYFYEFNSAKIGRPRNPASHRDTYVYMPFSREVWIVVYVSVFYLTAVVNAVSYLEKKSNWIRSFLKVIEAITACRTPFTGKKSVSRLLQFLIIFYAFLISLMYSVFLGTFFIKDVREMTIICLEKYFIDDSWKSLGLDIKLVPEDEFLDIIVTLNPSYGYCISPIFREYFLRNQDNKLFQLDAHKIIELWTPHRFFAEKDPKLAGPFNRYLSQIYSSGLLNYWKSLLGRAYVNQALTNLQHQTRTFEALNLHEFRLSMLLLLFGLSLAFVSFLLEVFLVKRKR